MVMHHTTTVECNENASNRIMDTNKVKTVVHTNKPGSTTFLNHQVNNEICQTTSVLYKQLSFINNFIHILVH